jgi:hypothetical protein
MMKENSTVDWKSKEYRRKYNAEYRQKKKREAEWKSTGKLSATSLLKDMNKPVSTWKQRQLERKAREDATKARPLGLECCPFCGASYFRKLGGKTEPIKMDHCGTCEVRFYYYKGVKE